MAARRLPPQTERAMEYVDSPKMDRRLKIGNRISCRIDGNYGVYTTQASINEEYASCTCPSDYYPCKHVRALIITYQKAPDSFLDVEELLNELKKRKKNELIDIIRDMILISPITLSALGIEGFEMDEEDEDEDEDEDEGWYR